MSDAIAVLNAGSSSIKFSLFIDRHGVLEPEITGQISGIHTRAHFAARSASGSVKAEKVWPEGTLLGHAGALDHLIGYLRSELLDNRLIGIGHRV
ncbi:MAG: acetate kinase, partial [Acidobacteriota bacterium]